MLVLYWKIKPGRERELTAEAGFPTFSSYGEPHVYSTPSLELPGLIKINYDGGPPCDPDSRDWATGGGDVASHVARWIEAFMPDHVETAGGPVVRQPCMYSMTPDKDFVIDFLGGEYGKDVVVGAGFSGHGFKMGPTVGRILAEMAMDGGTKTAAEAGVELRHFRISRFEGNAIVHTRFSDLLRRLEAARRNVGLGGSGSKSTSEHDLAHLIGPEATKGACDRSCNNWKMASMGRKFDAVMKLTF
uniref:FAD dependent oxidoreductase domain-containing protein n=1 Tax=Oryza brachyantha TaxID=4533 RepID=J3KZ95_ORYBR